MLFEDNLYSARHEQKIQELKVIFLAFIVSGAEANASRLEILKHSAQQRPWRLYRENRLIPFVDFKHLPMPLGESIGRSYFGCLLCLRTIVLIE